MTDEKILAVLETPAENESALEEMISKQEMSEDAVRAVRAALRLLDAFKDEVPSDTLRGLAAAAGMDMHMEEEREMMDEEKMMEEEEKGMMYQQKSDDPAALLKSADLPAEMRPVIEALAKSHAEASERVGELERVLKAERDQRLLKIETDRVAKSYSHVPGVEAEALAATMIQLRKGNSQALESFEKILAATETALVAKAAGAFEETGTNSVPAGSSSIHGRLEEESKALVQKGDFSTMEQAYDHLIQHKPELYASFLEEHEANLNR